MNTEIPTNCRRCGATVQIVFEETSDPDLSAQLRRFRLATALCERCQPPTERTIKPKPERTVRLPYADD
jgi:hypothetical protein